MRLWVAETSMKKSLMIFLLKEVEMGNTFWGLIQLTFLLEIPYRGLSSLFIC